MEKGTAGTALEKWSALLFRQEEGQILPCQVLFPLHKKDKKEKTFRHQPPFPHHARLSLSLSPFFGAQVPIRHLFRIKGEAQLSERPAELHWLQQAGLVHVEASDRPSGWSAAGGPAGLRTCDTRPRSTENLWW